MCTNHMVMCEIIREKVHACLVHIPLGKGNYLSLDKVQVKLFSNFTSIPFD